MQPETISSLRLVLGAMAAGLGLIAATFGFWSSIQTKTEQSPLRNWFGSKWLAIHNSGWLELPERLISWLFKTKNHVISKIILLASREEAWALSIVAFLVIVFVVVVIAALRRTSEQALTQLVRQHPILILAGAGVVLAGIPGTVGYFGALIAMVGLMISSLVVLPLPLAVAVSIITIPLFAFCQRLFREALSANVTWVEVKDGRLVPDIKPSQNVVRNERPTDFIALALGISFAVTMLATGFGHILDPKAWVPRTLQLLISNASFDALTIIVTLEILRRATRYRSALAIPAAIAVCVLLDAVLAIASLGCGLVFGQHQLRLCELVRLLVARSPGGESWDFGPNFWIMHTTFLPLAFYLAFLLLIWVAKTTLIPTSWFMKRGKHPDINPLAMTSRLIALIAAFCAAATYGLGFIPIQASGH